MLCDLHIHTYYSDGILTPSDIINEAKDKGIGLISVTDHNTTESYPEITELCRRNNIDIIQGVEIDCMLENKRVHVLAYGFDLENEDLQDLLKITKRETDENTKSTIYNMAKDYNIDLDDFEEFCSKPQEYSHFVIEYLLKKGIIKTMQELIPIYKKYGEDVSSVKLEDISTVIKVVRDAGGKAILAHPQDVYKEETLEYLKKAKDLGIDGVECYCPCKNQHLTPEIVDFAKENDMLITGGCDAHGGILSIVDGVELSIGVVEINLDDLNLGSMAKSI
ncbi:PHP domain-containing protein [Oceanirhabdus seepicola]|uniref:PHP domain-containing protein n=1 Tax=Oceanirhabdus seepicola TaxID=2828781 RepID=A0A9J6NZ24_9CLOT|nr:PHP domain-containing protein [Oceanirhabdus seepicola]MCM1988861.1 PHP domain-containing protein [Oceanirhabdus seepicola]